MKKETILNHIDKNILTMLETGGYDSAREKVYTILTKFKERIPNVILTDEEVMKLSDSRQRYTALYVMCAEKRIVDLYKIENKCIGSPLKSFKTLLFKEKLEKGQKLPQSYNQKYKDIVKKYGQLPF
jgi:hypothetical protein